MKEPSDRIRTTIYWPRALRDALQREAEKVGLTVNAYVVSTLIKHIEDEQRKRL